MANRGSGSWWSRGDSRGPVGWFLVAEILVLGIRASTTLFSGATWDIPGTGWRSVWQLVMVAISVVGLLSPRALRPATAAVGIVYLLATISELFNGATLIGAIPVDMRDRIIHPLVALLAGLALAVTATRPGLAGLGRAGDPEAPAGPAGPVSHTLR